MPTINPENGIRGLDAPDLLDGIAHLLQAEMGIDPEQPNFQEKLQCLVMFVFENADLVSRAESAEILHMSRQRFTQLVDTPSRATPTPLPLINTDRVTLWLRDEILGFRDARQPARDRMIQLLQARQTAD